MCSAIAPQSDSQTATAPTAPNSRNIAPSARYLAVLNRPLEGAYELLHHVFLPAPLADHAWVL